MNQSLGLSHPEHLSGRVCVCWGMLTGGGMLGLT